MWCDFAIRAWRHWLNLKEMFDLFVHYELATQIQTSHQSLFALNKHNQPTFHFVAKGKEKLARITTIDKSVP